MPSGPSLCPGPSSDVAGEQLGLDPGDASGRPGRLAATGFR